MFKMIEDVQNFKNSWDVILLSYKLKCLGFLRIIFELNLAK
jgi:hypothetical protein